MHLIFFLFLIFSQVNASLIITLNLFFDKFKAILRPILPRPPDIAPVFSFYYPLTF